jgi:hypothetical protein
MNGTLVVAEEIERNYIEINANDIVVECTSSWSQR